MWACLFVCMLQVPVIGIDGFGKCTLHAKHTFNIQNANLAQTNSIQLVAIGEGIFLLYTRININKLFFSFRNQNEDIL